jgi:hypothetical protein
MLLNNTLGAQRNCRWIYMGNNNWQWVCRHDQGGGGNKAVNPGALSGLGNQILTPAQMSALSIQNLRNIIADHRARIAEIDARVIYEAGLMYPWDESTKQMWLSEKASLLANIAAIEAWINLPSKDKARTDGGKFIINTRNTFLQSLNKLLPGNNNTFESGPGNFLNDTVDFLTTQYAGIPVWGIVLLAGAGIYVVTSNKAKQRK